MTTILSLITWAGTAALLFQPDPQFWVTLGLVISGGLTVYTTRKTDQRLQRQHEWEEKRRSEEKADRDRYQGWVRESIEGQAGTDLETKLAIRSDIAANAADARTAVGKAEKAVEVKLALSKETNELTHDVADTTHRIEEKIPPRGAED